MGKREAPSTAVRIDGGFWAERRALNRDRAVIYQWEQYERCGTIRNFRIAAGLETGGREGFFYTDSDLHKWADATSRILRSTPSAQLDALLNEYIRLVAKCQEPDGYLFTYNQIHFPGVRWKNLLIEHELYCHGHLIEAGVSHFEATGKTELLRIAEKAADLIVREFKDGGPERTSGHQEIELALIRLFRTTRKREYLETSRNLLNRRGHIPFFWLHFLSQVVSQLSRSSIASRQRQQTGGLGFEFGENLTAREPPFIFFRSAASFLSGAYQQQDRPLLRQLGPRGHCVRWMYQATAAAMLCREESRPDLLRWLESSWEAIVGQKMYVSGGIGALPVIEGFGRPFELDNWYSYSETCAAVGCVLWNREMSLATGNARYADLVEWLLFNATAVGISVSGDRYFYRNPLSAAGELERQPWYRTACCPSNISRLWAEIDRLVASEDDSGLCIDQYPSCHITLSNGVALAMESRLPWEGVVQIKVESPKPLKLRLRLPGWAERSRVLLNETEHCGLLRQGAGLFNGSRFALAEYLDLGLAAGCSIVKLELAMDVAPLSADRRVSADHGRVAVTRGPLLYCAESIDNPELDLDHVALDCSSLDYTFDPLLFGSGCGVILGRTEQNMTVRLVPYFAWGNRGASCMRVWLRKR